MMDSDACGFWQCMGAFNCSQDFQEAKPYGMFDKPHVFLSTALLIPVLGLNVTGWMVTSRSEAGGEEDSDCCGGE